MLKQVSLASWVTLCRLPLLALALLAICLRWDHGLVISAFVTAIAGGTDILDGYLARKQRRITALGANLDLLTDKLFVSTMLVVLAAFGIIHFWIPVVVIVREVAISLVRLRLLRGRQTLSSDAWGKAKMVVSMMAIVGLLLRQDMHQGGLLAQVSPSVPLFGILGLSPWAMLLAVTLTVLSGVNYAAKYLSLAQAGGRADSSA